MNPSPFDPLPALDGLERLERIGSGSSGVVYKAYQTSLKRYVALKVLRAPEFASAEELRRFRREADVLAAGSHPHIVPIHGYGEVEVGPGVRCPYFTMRLMEGGSLAGQVARLAGDPRASAEMVATIAGAVQHAHEQGVLHRDLKPANILLDAEGRPHVADFGLARRGDGGTGGTASGTVLGTPAYVAPEQARGENNVRPAADVYGLGAILYELLTGRPPFRGDSPAEVLRQVLREPPLSPRAVNRKVDRALEAVCLKCLKKDPARRYPSAQALADDLRRCLRGEPVSARPARPWDRLARGVRRRPAVAALVVLVLGLAGVGLAAALRPSQGRPSQRGWEWDCRQYLSQKEQITRRGYFGSVARVEGLAGRINVVRVRDDNRVDVLDEEDQRKLTVLQGLSHFDDPFRFGAISPPKVSWALPAQFVGFCDNARRVVGRQGSAVKVFDSLTGKEVGAFTFARGAPSGLETSPAGHYAAASWAEEGRPDRARHLEVWDTALGHKVSEMDCSPPVKRIALSPDGRRFAVQVGTFPDDQAAYVWEVHDSATGAGVALLKGDTGLDDCSAFSPDGGLFASVRAVQYRELAQDRAQVGNYRVSELTVWDAGTGERLYSVSRQAGAFSPFLCFTPDSSRLLTSHSTTEATTPDLPPDIRYVDDGFPEVVEVREARTGQELARFSFVSQKVRGVGAISPDGSRLIVPGTFLRTPSASEFVFTEPSLPPTPWPILHTRLAALLAAVLATAVLAAAVDNLFCLVRRLRARRRSAQTRPPRPEDRAASTTST
jgi:tRNA A-37 threonylcarbamoyl transferase component Bud32